MGGGFSSCQHHIHKGQAVFPPHPAASLVPSICPAAEDRAGAPSNRGQKVTPDVPGCRPPRPPFGEENKVVALTGACACVHACGRVCVCLHTRATSPPRRQT